MSISSLLLGNEVVSAKETFECIPFKRFAELELSGYSISLEIDGDSSEKGEQIDYQGYR